MAVTGRAAALAKLFKLIQPSSPSVMCKLAALMVIAALPDPWDGIIR
jgi:hypothetical protein